jgi:iron(III) transport system ATP-binding protein
VNLSAAALELRGLTVPIAGRDVVRGVDLSVTRGELVSLVGPSGCGKSTLLRAVAGLIAASSGSVLLDGEVVDRLPPEKRRVGLVFQDHALFPHLSVAANVAFGLRSTARRERAERVAELLELVRLPHAAKRYPHQLSGGEQQRIALARALAPSPAVVLLDEPFASLDAALRDDLRSEVVGLLRTAGATALLVTHDREEALALGERVAVMHEGVIEQADEPATVFHRPATRFVATFLGPASFLAARRDGCRWATALGPVALEGLQEGREATVMVRPHDLRLTAGGHAVVTARRFAPAGYVYDVELADGTEVHAEGNHAEPLDVGDACTVAVAADHRLATVP